MGIIMQELSKSNSQIEYIFSKTFFESERINILLQIRKLFSQRKIFSITASRHYAIIDVQNNMAMSDDFHSFFEYLSIVKDITYLEKIFQISEINEADSQEEYLKSFDSKSIVIGVDVLIWQMMLTVLESQVLYTNKSLQLKLKYMPNLSELQEYLPKHALEVFSCCLIAPRSMEEVSKQFPNISAIDLSHIFVFALLSDIADINIAYESIQKKAEEKHDDISSSKNSSVKRAKKTGFFNRLINALVN